MQIKDFSCLVFDWNGTVVDDRWLCHALLNEMLVKRGHPTVTFERYLDVFRFPVKEYYRDAGFCFPPDGEDDFEALAVFFRDVYERDFPKLNLYPGVKDFIESAKPHLPVYLLSATREDLLLEEVSEKGLDGLFTALIGIKDIYGASKLEAGRAYFMANGVDVSHALFIGDTLHDEEVALALGGHAALIASGHQSKERLLKGKREETACFASMADLKTALFKDA